LSMKRGGEQQDREERGGFARVSGLTHTRFRRQIDGDYSGRGQVKEGNDKKRNTGVLHCVQDDGL
jgi:hypothetical protein